MVCSANLARSYTMWNGGKLEISTYSALILIRSRPDRNTDFPRLPAYNPWSEEWHIKKMYRYDEYGLPPKPHLVVSLLSGVYATGLDEGLTVYELQAIVNLMAVRTYGRTFCRFQFHPVSDLTFLIIIFTNGFRCRSLLSRIWAHSTVESYKRCTMGRG